MKNQAFEDVVRSAGDNDDWLAKQPDEMRVLLGREDFLNTTGGAYSDPKKLPRTFNWAKE